LSTWSAPWSPHHDDLPLTCVEARHVAEVTSGSESDSVPTGASAAVGGLRITNNHYVTREQAKKGDICYETDPAHLIGGIRPVEP
jgi:hypothetical protein